MLCALNESKLSSEECRFFEQNRTHNFSGQEWLHILEEYRTPTGYLSATAETVLIIVYSLLIGFGISANLLVCFVVARKSQMHTPRNLYIVNLSISDMTMCVICMPFTLIRILRRQWNLGFFLCKLVPVLEGSNIMISIGTITMIALDRYFTIVRRHNSVSSRSSVIICIISVWAFSILFTMPLAYYQVVEPVTVKQVYLYDTCIEKWPSHNLRIIYTTCILLVQAIIPALVVGVVHARIASYLHTHAKSQKNVQRAHRELRRNKKTTILLLGVVVLFVASWLPLNLYTLLADILYPPELVHTVSPEKLYITLSICHVTAMSSAVSNPIVYGWLNANIRYEFLQLFSSRCTGSRLQQQKNGGDEQTTTKTLLATSTQRKSGPVTLQLKSEKFEKPANSTPAVHIDSFML